jgi:hypothetical protein
MSSHANGNYLHNNMYIYYIFMFFHTTISISIYFVISYCVFMK